MSLNADKLLAWSKEAVTELSTKSSALYALGIGLGADPVDTRQLAYLYEKNLVALPTQAMVMGVFPDYIRDPEIGVDMVRMLHGESGLVIHKPLPAVGKVKAVAKIDHLLDRGESKGAACYFSTEIFEVESGAHLATTSGCFIMRGNGGFGGPSGPAPAPQPIPERAPDLTVDMPTLPQAGLIYRLSGDTNPLHIDPAVARKAGFERPILHGLASFGVAGHGVLSALCDYDASRFRALKVRYSAPVYPGETIRVELFRLEKGQYAVRCKVLERDLTVLNNGYVEVME